MSTYLEQAAAAGYATLTDPATPVDTIAARMLASDDQALGVALGADVLQVALTRVPTPARVAELEDAAGMAITVTVTSPELFTRLRTAALAQPAGHPSHLLAGVLTEAVAKGATDVLLAVGKRPALKVAGAYITAPVFPPLTNTDISEGRTWFLGNKTRGVVTLGATRWRVTTGTSNAAGVLALRALPAAPRTLEQIHAPVVLLRAASLNAGLILIAGGPGAGKTTTSAAVVDHINTARPAHIAVIGDPVEYRHRSRAGIITELNVGADIPDNAAGVAAARALGADAIVSDVRTVAEARAALAAALGGALVVATVDATRVSDAIRSWTALFPPDERLWAATTLAASLRAATAQTLLTTLSGERVVSFETMAPTPSVRAALREGRFDLLDAALEDEHSDETTSMARALAVLTATGRISQASARTALDDHALYDQHLAALATTVARPRSLPSEAPPSDPARRATTAPPVSQGTRETLNTSVLQAPPVRVENSETGQRRRKPRH